MSTATVKKTNLLTILTGACCAPLPEVTLPVDLVRIAKALADETRLRLLAQIAASNEPVCVCDLVESAPVNQPTVSHHLKILREAGIVTSEKRGTWAYYALGAAPHPLVQAALQEIRYSPGCVSPGT